VNAPDRPARRAAPGPDSGPQQIVRDILDGLSEGRFAPGQRLAEPDLMQRYGVARSTVREALSRLAAQGTVTLAPHRGAVVRMLTRREAADVLRLSEALLGLAARQAAEAVAAGADGAALAAASADYLAAGVTDAPPAADALARRAAARRRYYRALTDLAGNRDLARLLAALQVHLIRAHLRAARPGDIGDQRALARAVLAGAPGPAEAAARRHVRRLHGVLAALPDALFADAAAG
jgi:DNA-binding GntR family transcriptional regulator